MNGNPARLAAAPQGSVLIHGAGAIGLFLGGRLALAGVPVCFVGRPPVVDRLLRAGLRIGDIDGRFETLPPDRIDATTRLDACAAPALVLLTVKGTATRAAATELQAALPAGTPVISFQNGVDNRARLADAAPSLTAIAGMVPFNVVQPEPGLVQQATSGRLAASQCAATLQWAARFASAGLPLELYRDMRPVQWGKLLLNLNNPLNALAGIPLRTQLQDRRYRLLLARLQDEALIAMQAAGIHPARVTPLPSRWLPALLRLPTPLFRLLAARMLKIHPQARLSMHADRVQGRPTEIDDLCGAVIRLAESGGLDAPANRALRKMIIEAPPDRWFDATEIDAAMRGDTPWSAT